MTIQLPIELEHRVEAAVRDGRFASVDEAMAEAARLLLGTLLPQGSSPAAPGDGPGLIGALRADADLLDQAVEHAMQVREERPGRLSHGE